MTTYFWTAAAMLTTLALTACASATAPGENVGTSEDKLMMLEGGGGGGSSSGGSSSGADVVDTSFDCPATDPATGASCYNNGTQCSCRTSCTSRACNPYSYIYNPCPFGKYPYCNAYGCWCQ